MTAIPKLLWLAAAAAITLAPTPSRAQSTARPPDEPAPATADAVRYPVSVALLGGYSINGADEFGQTGNMFGVGFGARAGYTFPVGVYAGLSAVYDLGYTKDLGQGATASSRLFPVGVEGGYDLRLGAFTVRPFVGAGVAFYRSSQDGPPPTMVRGSGTKPALWPGVVGTVDATDHLFAGIDLRYTIVWTGAESYDVSPGGGAPSAFGAFAEIGYRI